MIDLNHGSHAVYGAIGALPVADRVNALIDAALILTGSLADADATFTTLVEHGDAANLSDAAAVPDDQLLGLETQASFLFSDDDKVFKIGLRTSKRYARVTITPAANAGNAFIAGVWILGHPRNAPTPNPPA